MQLICVYLWCLGLPIALAIGEVGSSRAYGAVAKYGAVAGIVAILAVAAWGASLALAAYLGGYFVGQTVVHFSMPCWLTCFSSKRAAAIAWRREEAMLAYAAQAAGMPYTQECAAQ